MKQPNYMLLVGMLTQALVAGTLSLIGFSTLNPYSQVIVAITFLAFCILYQLIIKQLNKNFIGMAIQATLTGAAGNFLNIQLTFQQQFLCAAMYSFILLIIWTASRSENINQETTPYPSRRPQMSSPASAYQVRPVEPRKEDKSVITCPYCNTSYQKEYYLKADDGKLTCANCGASFEIK